MPGAVSIRGLTELNRAFTRAGKQTRREIRLEMAAVAEPVRQAAERLAVAKIRNIGPDWSVMRTGVTQKLVYVAPFQRGIKRGRRKRPNLAPLILERALDPALEQNRSRIEAAFEQMLDRIASDWESDTFVEIDPHFRG